MSDVIKKRTSRKPNEDLKPKRNRNSSDVRWPYKMAVLILYGRLEGVLETSPGVKVVNYHQLRKFIGNLSAPQIRKHLETCVELGVLSYIQHHGQYAVIKLNPPSGMVVGASDE